MIKYQKFQGEKYDKVDGNKSYNSYNQLNQIELTLTKESPKILKLNKLLWNILGLLNKEEVLDLLFVKNNQLNTQVSEFCKKYKIHKLKIKKVCFPVDYEFSKITFLKFSSKISTFYGLKLIIDKCERLNNITKFLQKCSDKDMIKTVGLKFVGEDINAGDLKLLEDNIDFFSKILTDDKKDWSKEYSVVAKFNSLELSFDRLIYDVKDYLDKLVIGNKNLSILILTVPLLPKDFEEYCFSIELLKELHLDINKIDFNLKDILNNIKLEKFGLTVKEKIDFTDYKLPSSLKYLKLKNVKINLQQFFGLYNLREIHLNKALNSEFQIEQLINQFLPKIRTLKLLNISESNTEITLKQVEDIISGFRNLRVFYFDKLSKYEDIIATEQLKINLNPILKTNIDIKEAREKLEEINKERKLQLLKKILTKIVPLLLIIIVILLLISIF